MSGNKTRCILAIIALVFMAIFSVTLVSPDMWNGAVAYAALVSGLLGAGLFLVLRFLLKPEESNPDGEREGEQESEPDDEQK